MITVQVDTREIEAALNGMRGKLRNPRPMFAHIGEQLTRSTQERFVSQTSPEGDKWKDLSPRYKAKKHPNRDKILTREGHLKGTLRYFAGASKLEFGSNRPQAALLHFGGSFKAWGKADAKMPARPWLGLTDKDKDMIIRTARRYFAP